MADYIICDNGNHRPMTKEEIAYLKNNSLIIEANAAEQIAIIEAKTAAKVSARAKLKALGLSDEEIAALVG